MLATILRSESDGASAFMALRVAALMVPSAGETPFSAWNAFTFSTSASS